MVLTRDFKETVQRRVQRDPAFRRALLREAAESMLSGDMAAGKAVLRDYINSTIGFPELAEATQIPSKSLMRMLGPNGNPRANNIFDIMAFVQRHEGVRFQVKTAGERPKRRAS
ncbi:MAG: DNA-binding protein [Bryobacteraceae bacterium]